MNEVSPIRVLLVDDHAVVRSGLSAFLLAYDDLELVGEAGSGAEALAKCQESLPDVILMDMLMPDMDGLVVITKLKEIDADIQTVLLTGHGDEKLMEATEALNASYFEKEDMGKFWSFVRKALLGLERTMAAAGMATGGDLEDAVDIESHKAKKK